MHIDLSTLLLQAINLLVLLALLRWLLYRPLQSVIAARRALVAKELADASDKAAQAQQAASANRSKPMSVLPCSTARRLTARRGGSSEDGTKPCLNPPGGACPPGGPQQGARPGRRAGRA